MQGVHTSTRSRPFANGTKHVWIYSKGKIDKRKEKKYLIQFLRCQVSIVWNLISGDRLIRIIIQGPVFQKVVSGNPGFKKLI